jgi:hypothetical protein
MSDKCYAKRPIWGEIPIPSVGEGGGRNGPIDAPGREMPGKPSISRVASGFRLEWEGTQR